MNSMKHIVPTMRMPALARLCGCVVSFVVLIAVVLPAAPAAAEPKESAHEEEPTSITVATELQPSSAILPCAGGADGCFQDLDGRWRNSEVAYRELHRRGPPHRVRAAVEMMLMLGIGTSWYWIDRERQVADWDYPSLRQRLSTEVLRLDNNSFGINFIAHPLDGAAFHALSRANNLSFAESFAYGLVTSLVWEYGLEFREKVSVNDIIVTTAAGLTVGEFAHRLAQYVHSGPDKRSLAHRAARWSAGITLAVHEQIDGELTRADGYPVDALGLDGDIGHELRLTYSLTEARGDGELGEGVDGDSRGQIHAVDFAGRLVMIPGYLRPGRFSRWFYGADINRLRMNANIGAGGRGVDLYTDTVLMGHFRQAISTAGIGGAIAVGTSMGFRYRREKYDLWYDQFGVAHLPGLAVDADMRGATWSLSLYGRTHGDFAGLRAPTYAEWEEANPDEVAKSILRKQSYYYGWGVSSRAGAVLRLPHVHVGGELFYGRYWSQQGLDRTQESVTADIAAASTMIDGEAWLRLYPWRTAPYYAALTASMAQRRSRVDTLRERSRIERYTLSMGLSF